MRREAFAAYTSRMRRPVVTTLVALLLAALVGGQAPRKTPSVWSLPSGERHEGRLSRRTTETVIVTAVGDLVLDRPNGALPADARADVVLVEAAEAGLHPKFVDGRVAVARMAASFGLWSTVKFHLDAALELDPFHVDARTVAQALGRRFRVVAEDDDRFGSSKRIEALFTAAAGSPLAAAMIEGRLGDFDAALRLQFGLRFLKRGDAPQRLLAARVLAPCTDAATRIKPLYEACLLDPTPAVRRAASKALGRSGDPALARIVGRTLSSPHQTLRLAAVEAITEMGFREGAPYLVRALAGENPVPKAHISVTRSIAGVTDYDVEVAAGAVIAKPIVTLTHEGVVLEAGVVSIAEERLRITAGLKTLTGLDLPADAKAWKSALGL